MRERDFTVDVAINITFPYSHICKFYVILLYMPGHNFYVAQKCHRAEMDFVAQYEAAGKISPHNMTSKIGFSGQVKYLIYRSSFYKSYGNAERKLPRSASAMLDHQMHQQLPGRSYVVYLRPVVGKLGSGQTCHISKVPPSGTHTTTGSVMAS